MKLTSKGDYATRILIELSTAEGPEPISVHELAGRTGISMKYLEQIMMRLRAAHLVRSHRGVHGGYELARPPEDLTVGEVVRLMDGPLAPSPCASQSAHVACPIYRCPSEASCVLRGLWVEVREAIAGVLDTTTFAESDQPSPTELLRREVCDLMNSNANAPLKRGTANPRRSAARHPKVRFGYVQVIVQDGQAIQIDTMEKKRLDRLPR